MPDLQMEAQTLIKHILENPGDAESLKKNPALILNKLNLTSLNADMVAQVISAVEKVKPGPDTHQDSVVPGPKGPEHLDVWGRAGLGDKVRNLTKNDIINQIAGGLNLKK